MSVAGSRRVAAGMIVERGHVLVQTRTEPGPWAGFWEFPGGGVEPGEDGPACVRRECLEEVGLQVRPLRCLHALCWSDGERRVELEFWLCARSSPQPEPRPCQGQQLLWATATQLADRRFLPANEQVLELLAPLLE